jgi:parallel beta-helix repeat protein
MRNITFLFAAILLLISGCKEETNPGPTYKYCLEFGPGQEDEIIAALLSLEDSVCVNLKAGNYAFENLSIVGLETIMFSGAGMDSTVIDFSGQTSGGEGILVTDVKNFIIKDMTILDSEGDLLKIRNGENIVIRNLAAIWNSDLDSTNGGYGLYPVLCKNVLIEGCYVQGASDAGIYVGQSDQVVVRNSEAFMNVAGCEIENTTNANVYNNEFHGNTGGLLIFDLPGLSKKGGYVKAYNNNIHDNNAKNFAPSSSFGTTTGVGNCPPGSGILHVSTSNVEIYNNTIKDNNLASIYVVSGLVLDENALDYIGPNYDPFPRNVYIHDNAMSKQSTFPPAAYDHELGSQLILLHETLNGFDPVGHPYMQHILIDGANSNIVTSGTDINPDNLCIKETEDILFMNVDWLNAETPEWNLSTDVTPYTCP